MGVRGRWFKVLVQDYFSDLFQSELAREVSNVSRYFYHIKTKLSDQAVGVLSAPFSEMEVKAAVFQLAPIKAPGPDGFSAVFYQKCWHILKTELSQKICKMLNDGQLEEGINDTDIVLIPKVKNPGRLQEFRPISLCNSVGKIISKMLANRMKTVLPDIISESQSAFVPGRNISDNYLIAHEVSHFINTRLKQKTGFFSLKTDMSKAYDRIEWDFLKGMLMAFGFPDKWVQLIMHSIGSVKYRIKINGSRSDFVIPQRGLRQGDPISPYLFIICAEWLARKIYEYQGVGRFNGIQISRGAPLVSHLFFADDSIFFSKATEANANILGSILLEYQGLSGQAVNLSKSEVVFSRNVDMVARSGIMKVLGIKQAESHSKYLGLPLCFGRRKADLFRYLIERTWQKVHGWKEKMLSFAGKEVLIKSVLLAVPVYPMMCFKLPESVCRKISGIILRYWWSHKSENRAISWVKKSYLSRDKAEGGLKFRDLENFNDALLAKQYWKLFSDPTALVSRLFKAKYYKGSDIHSSQLGPMPSFAWRSIWNASRILKSWMVLFSDGRPSWCLESHGVFSVRSAYSKLNDLKQVASAAITGESSDKREVGKFWKAVWRIKLQNKLKFFVWRLFHNALPVAQNLWRRGANLDLQCQICGLSLEHTFLECWWAKSFWSELGFPHCWEAYPFDNVKEWLWFCFKSYPAETFALVCYGASMIWQNRNLITHNDKGLDIGHVAAVSKNRVCSFNSPSFKFSVIGFEGSLSWVAPTGSIVKINCDGSVLAEFNRSGVGGVARDAQGMVMGVFADSLDSVVDSVEVEGLAVLMALRWALRSNYKECIIETDCAVVFSLIQSFSGWNASGKGWIAECADILSKNGKWRLCLIFREANVAADGLGRKAAMDGWKWSNPSAIPGWIKELL